MNKSDIRKKLEKELEETEVTLRELEKVELYRERLSKEFLFSKS